MGDSQLRNQICARICARDAAGHPEMGETRKPGDDFAEQACRGQDDDWRRPETAETGVVWLITQRWQGCGPHARRWRALLPSLCNKYQGAVSDSGSRMGAAGRSEARSEAVTVPDRMSLTCRNIVQQRLRQVVRSVHTEEVTGSIPVSPTQVSGRFGFIGPAILILVQQQSAAAGTHSYESESSHCPSFSSASRVAAEGTSV